MPKSSPLYGQHRSFALAERHRRALEKELGIPVEITARRNAEGRYSERGHFFTFKWEAKEKQATEIAIYGLLVDNERSNHYATVEFSFYTNDNPDLEDVFKAIEERLKDGFAVEGVDAARIQRPGGTERDRITIAKRSVGANQPIVRDWQHHIRQALESAEWTKSIRTHRAGKVVAARGAREEHKRIYESEEQ